MSQAIKKRRERKEPVNEMLVRVINIGLAAKTLNDVLNHVDVPLQRERVALAIFNKLVPSMQAVAVNINDNRPTSVHDLNAMLLSSGLDPLAAPTEKTIVPAIAEDPGTPEKSDA